MASTSTAANVSGAIVKPIRPSYVETIADRERAHRLAREAVERGTGSVYFVGCGGSLASSGPVHAMLESTCEQLTSFRMTSNEFNYRLPRRLGPRSLVVVASHTGTTPETLAAVATARAAGVPTVIGYTRSVDSPLGRTVDEVFESGPVKTAWDPKEVMLAHLGHGLLAATGTDENLEEITAAYDALPVALPRAIADADELCARIAKDLKDVPVTYVLGAGPLESVAYSFAMCLLQEMQWMHAASFNAGEFFHGAFEVVTEGVPVIVFLGEDTTRPMAERAMAFVKRYTSLAYAIDSRDLTLPGVPAGVRAEIAPIALSAIASRLAQHYEAVRGHDLSIRRYMFEVEY